MLSSRALQSVTQMSRVPVACLWSPSSYFGWGVYGLNLALAWATDADVRPLFPCGVSSDSLAVDRLRLGRLAETIAESNKLRNGLGGDAARMAGLAGPVLAGLGNGLAGPGHEIARRLRGTARVAIVFFEDSRLAAEERARAGSYDLFVAGSTWDADLLRRAGIRSVVTVLQGVDPTLFHPAPASGLFGDRFLVFSGGKLEHRKGQDLVLKTFRAFAARHSEAMLVTAWHSPWPRLAASLDGDSTLTPPRLDAAGRLDVRGWAAANGVAADQVVDLGMVPNALLPPILREMNAALFMNRAEGGTNLVAMECMACGVPTIVSANTGHLDLIQGDTVLPLTRQRRVAPRPPFRDTEGWGESDVEEALAALERLWHEREHARAIGQAGAAFMSRLTWTRTADALKLVLKPFLAAAGDGVR